MPDRYRHIAADYLQALDDRKSVLVVSPDPCRRQAASRRRSARSCGRPEGSGAEDREFTRLVQVDTQPRRNAGRRPPTGRATCIQFHQNAKGGFTKGDRLTVTDPAAVPLDQADKFSLYRPETIALADRRPIRFTGTVKTLDGEHTLKNGMAHTVAGLHAGRQHPAR